MDNKRIVELRKIIADATPLEKWEGTSNYPFYVSIKKPAPSLSKHDDSIRGQHLWRYQDGVYLLTAVHELPKALNEIERLQKENKALYEVNIKLQADNKRLEEIVEECKTWLNVEKNNESN